MAQEDGSDLTDQIDPQEAEAKESIDREKREYKSFFEQLRDCKKVHQSPSLQASDCRRGRLLDFFGRSQRLP